MDITNLPEADKTQLKDILLAERAAGVEHPLLPLNVDLNGDGIADAWGLDEAGELTLVPGVALKDTVYKSEGDDVAGVE